MAHTGARVGVGTQSKLLGRHFDHDVDESLVVLRPLVVEEPYRHLCLPGSVLKGDHCPNRRGRIEVAEGSGGHHALFSFGDGRAGYVIAERLCPAQVSGQRRISGTKADSATRPPTDSRPIGQSVGRRRTTPPRRPKVRQPGPIRADLPGRKSAVAKTECRLTRRNLAKGSLGCHEDFRFRCRWAAMRAKGNSHPRPGTMLREPGRLRPDRPSTLGPDHPHWRKWPLVAGHRR